MLPTENRHQQSQIRNYVAGVTNKITKLISGFLPYDPSAVNARSIRIWFTRGRPRRRLICNTR